MPAKISFPGFLYSIKRKRILPRFVSVFIYRHFRMLDLRTDVARHMRACDDKSELSTYPSPYPFRLGIVREMRNNHIHFINACKELKVSYGVIDISGPNWIDDIEESGCDAFLVYPSVAVSIWKQMFDERINLMVTELNKIVYPSYKEIWIFENKRRMAYWLKANGLPQPETYIFYDKETALGFAESTELPVVFKSISSSGGRGVRILRDRKGLERFIKRYFKRGFLPDFHEKMDREWGSMLFQEYLPDVREIRIIRMGDSYFGYEKLRSSRGLHSGSGKFKYSRPSDECLFLAKEITEKGGFTSMDLDVFVTLDGRLLINELQTFFGTNYKKEMCVVDNKPGRMIYDHVDNTWKFEPGSFCNNNLCNLRVSTLLKMLSANRDTRLQTALPV